MPRLIANAARVGIDLLPHIERIDASPEFAVIVDLAVAEAYEIRRREAEASKGKR